MLAAIGNGRIMAWKVRGSIESKGASHDAQSGKYSEGTRCVPLRTDVPPGMLAPTRSNFRSMTFGA